MSPLQGNHHDRLGFEDALEMSRLPDVATGSDEVVQRFMSHQPGWSIPWDSTRPSRKPPVSGAFGGVVYALAPLAAARIVEEEDIKSGNGQGKLGITSIQGVFTSPGLTDRPYVLDVSPIMTARSMSTKHITVRQPVEPASNPNGRFERSDIDRPLANMCFTCYTSFKRSQHNAVDQQATFSVQQRFAELLSSRAPTEWLPTPQTDVAEITDKFPDAGHGSFPVCDMYNVDMTEYNAGKPVTERQQLTLYRPTKPISLNDPNAHIVTHAYAADRNGLLTLSNHLGYGYRLKRAASLSYSFYVHTNAEEAVMRDDGWWVLEMSWPRISATRALIEVKIWSPDGKHVATSLQDGLVFPMEETPKEKL